MTRLLITLLSLFAAATAQGQWRAVFEQASQEVTSPRDYPAGFDRPHDLALSPDGQRLFVASGDGDNVRQVDAVPTEVRESLPINQRPALLCAWWLLVTVSEQFASHGLAVTAMPVLRIA
mgnify:CR=1 FL=1